MSPHTVGPRLGPRPRPQLCHCPFSEEDWTEPVTWRAIRGGSGHTIPQRLPWQAPASAPFFLAGPGRRTNSSRDAPASARNFPGRR